jgi:hypothetical protein
MELSFQKELQVKVIIAGMTVVSKECGHDCHVLYNQHLAKLAKLDIIAFRSLLCHLIKIKSIQNISDTESIACNILKQKNIEIIKVLSEVNPCLV